jgi:hypothetical protein
MQRADAETHFGDEGPVKQVERALVRVVLHVVDVRAEFPVDGFGAEDDVIVVGAQGIDRPVLVRGPCFDRFGEYERRVGPILVKFLWGEVGETRDLVAGGDVTDVRIEGDVGAIEWAVEGVGVETGAVEDGYFRRRKVEIGRSPCSFPGERAWG